MINPDNLPSIRCRLLASDVTGIAEAGAVTTWTDRINSYAFTQGTAGQRPLFYGATTAHTINGKPTIHFDGVDDLLRYVGTMTTATTGYIGMVIRPHSGIAQDIITSADEATAVRYFAGPYITSVSSIARVAVQQRDNDTADNIYGDNAAITVEDPCFLECGSSGTAWALRVNGTLTTLTTTTGSNTGDWFGDTSLRDSVVLGALKRTTEAGFFSGDIAEVIICDAGLPTEYREALQQYIGNTYGHQLTKRVTVPVPRPRFNTGR